ncbi:hypothetical protein AG1IA_05078 [Rhizoctonia solani AG-1 IA]|uniref:Uncharacterized protein n=1 Tax=Thanatephorus cucumeris (strain AG1-IA) TaxID=983506 RepID=L8WX15_THACA|nr:hypothetical protein AG1IA_05078 [Rhizoctonia solani AG-1 IA]
MTISAKSIMEDASAPKPKLTRVAKGRENKSQGSGLGSSNRIVRYAVTTANGPEIAKNECIMIELTGYQYIRHTNPCPTQIYAGTGPTHHAQALYTTHRENMAATIISISRDCFTPPGPMPNARAAR